MVCIALACNKISAGQHSTNPSSAFTLTFPSPHTACHHHHLLRLPFSLQSLPGDCESQFTDGQAGRRRTSSAPGRGGRRLSPAALGRGGRRRIPSALGRGGRRRTPSALGRGGRLRYPVGVEARVSSCRAGVAGTHQRGRRACPSSPQARSVATAQPIVSEGARRSHGGRSHPLSCPRRKCRRGARCKPLTSVGWQGRQHLGKRKWQGQQVCVISLGVADIMP